MVAYISDSHPTIHYSSSAFVHSRMATLGEMFAKRDEDSMVTSRKRG